MERGEGCDEARDHDRLFPREKQILLVVGIEERDYH